MKPINNIFTNWWATYQKHVRKVVLSNEPEDAEKVSYWRNTVFYTILTYLAPLSLIALIPSVYISFLTGLPIVGIVDLFTFFTIVVITVVPGIKLEHRKAIFIFILYCLSVTLLYFLPFPGTGFLFLLAVTIFSTLIYSSFVSYFSAWMNTLICVLFALLIYFGIDSTFFYGNDLGIWIALSSNLVFLSFACAKFLDLLLTGLTTSFKRNKVSEIKLEKANRLYQFISQINQTIVHVKDSETLFRNSCRIAIEFGKYKMAWIGCFDTTQKKITLLDSCGIPGEDIILFTDITYLTDGPQEYVLNTGKYFLCNDIERTLESERWKPYAEKHNIRSFIVLPINKSGKIFGTFNIYATEKNYFDKDDIASLLEVTGDISFALDLFEKAERHEEAEKLILKNEKRFRALIENSADMITLSSKEGKVLYGSPSITKLFGYSDNEIYNITALNFIHPGDITEFAKNRKKLLESPGKSYHSQIRLRHSDGRWIWCETTITNLLHDPDINALVSNFRDISEKKEVEKQKEFDTNNLNALINNTADLMWSVDRNFNLITSNIPFNEAGKVNFGKVIAKGENVLSAAFSPEMRSHFKQLYERAFAGESFTEIEHFSLPDELWTQISYYPIRRGDEVIGTACHSIDITGIKKTEQQLSKSETKLKEAQALSHISNWEVDLVTNDSTWSDEFYNTLGLSREEIEPSPEAFLSMIHPDDFEFAKAKVEETFQTFEAGSFNARTKNRNGSIKYIYTEWKFEFDTKAKPIRLYGILQDVSERKIAELERSKITNDLVQRNRDLEQFTFIISHNLRAPTANIIGFTEILQDETLSQQEQNEFLQGLSISVAGLDTIIKDISTILQVKHKVNEKKETMFFSKLVNDVITNNGNLIEKHNVEIKTDFSETDEIFSLKVYMYSIFYNLISNSIKYCNPDVRSLIEIKSRKENGNIILTFKDNGLGIDIKTIGDKVFGLYQRFHSHVEGKGMGLFMVKTQVEAIGGKITVVSELNKGTEFTILLEN